MDPADAARLWVEAWVRGWIAHDADLVASRYSDACEFRSHPFREPIRGRDGARQYAVQAFAEERTARPNFGVPVVDLDGRAAVEYRADITTIAGQETRLAGVSVLRFDSGGFVTEHRDYWAME
jgi:SnoaL-like domain